MDFKRSATPKRGVAICSGFAPIDPCPDLRNPSCMDWQKKYRWTRTWGKEPGLNGEPHEDFAGYDGDQIIGRTYLDQQTLKAGKFFWAAYMPKSTPPLPTILPHSGWLPTSAEAAKRVEDYWDAAKGRAGL